MTTLNKKPGRLKLLIYLFCTLGFIIATIATGYLMRDEVLSLAGPVRIVVQNKSETKLRYDLSLSDQLATIELDQGESEEVRFNPKERAPFLAQIYRKSSLLKTVEFENIEPDQISSFQLTSMTPTETIFKPIDE